MYDVFYIDVYVLVNTLMDFFILSIMKVLLKNESSYGRIFLGSLFGALAACAILFLPPIPWGFRLGIIHIVVNVLTLKVGLRIKGLRELVKGILLLYVVTFLFGGAVGWLGEAGLSCVRLLLYAFFTFVLIRAVYIILQVAKSHDKNIYPVTILWGDEQKTVNGLLDTGNMLFEPYHHQPVCVAEYDILSELLKNGDKKVRYIPYQSIGNPTGLMPVITVDKVLIGREKDLICRKNVVVGMVQESLSPKGRYQMIIHPALLP